jgi:TRAP-type mannitol/chloroaromatic compound transport system permease small subunit
MDRIEKIAQSLKALGGMVITALLVAQIMIVALRYVFALGWPWAVDLLVYLFYISVLLPMLVVLIANATVRVDVFYAGWRQPMRDVVDRVALLVLFAPIMAYAAWASWGTTQSSWRVLEASPTYGGLPGYFLLKTLLTLTFAALAVVALLMGLRKQPYTTQGEGVSQ